MALHREVGPARTTFSAIAHRAGVQRHTLYRHFPTEPDVLRACRDHFIATHPFPDPAGWRDLPAGAERLRAGLAALYGYYAANREMVGNVLRDSDLLPVGRGFREAMARTADSLADGWPAARGRAVRAALALATDFFTWRSLADGPRLAPSEAADLMSRMVGGAQPASAVGFTSSAPRPGSAAAAKIARHVAKTATR